ncbi:hypothetical protein SAMN05446635_0254 [Burkholderia sp. OK233]|nr:hypothetical protein SAMN05446635_0254 [Burkholderia sp. OK233]
MSTYCGGDPIALTQTTVRIERHHSYHLEHAGCYHRKRVQSEVYLFFSVGFNQYAGATLIAAMRKLAVTFFENGRSQKGN